MLVVQIVPGLDLNGIEYEQSNPLILYNILKISVMYLAIMALCGVTAASSVQWSVQMWSQRQGWLDGDII